MAKFRERSVIVEAITFDELIEHARSNGSKNPFMADGLPWSFTYQGYPVSHENDECYLINTEDGTQRVTPQDMIITNSKGIVYPLRINVFDATYERID